MTPHERASYLIKEVGIEKAVSHVNWVIGDVKKKLTKQYWEEIMIILKEKQNELPGVESV